MSTVPGNPALPAPLAPAMHPGDRDTHLDLDDLIDHSHEATQQASAGAQHPTRRWKRGVQRSGVSYPATTVPDGGRAATGTDEHHIQWRGLRIQRKAGDCVLPWSDGLLPVVVIPSVGIH